MKIEKEYFVSNGSIKVLNEGINFSGGSLDICIYRKESDYYSRKIKISWDAPEKKVEITEKDIENIYIMNGCSMTDVVFFTTS